MYPSPKRSDRSILLPALIEPPVFVPAENFSGAKVVDSLWWRVPGFVLRLAGDVVGVFLVGNLSDRVAVLGLMRFADGNLAICGVGRGFETISLAEVQFRQIVRFAVVQILPPMSAEFRELRGRFPEFNIALDPVGRNFCDQRFHLLTQRLFRHRWGVRHRNGRAIRRRGGWCLRIQLRLGMCRGRADQRADGERRYGGAYSYILYRRHSDGSYSKNAYLR